MLLLSLSMSRVVVLVDIFVIVVRGVINVDVEKPDIIRAFVRRHNMKVVPKLLFLQVFS